jgi:hypothetical protein
VVKYRFAADELLAAAKGAVLKEIFSKLFAL